MKLNVMKTLNINTGNTKLALLFIIQVPAKLNWTTAFENIIRCGEHFYFCFERNVGCLQDHE